MEDLKNNNNSCLPKTSYMNYCEICKNIYPQADRLTFLTFAIPVPY